MPFLEENTHNELGEPARCRAISFGRYFHQKHKKL